MELTKVHSNVMIKLADQLLRKQLVLRTSFATDHPTLSFLCSFRQRETLEQVRLRTTPIVLDIGAYHVIYYFLLRRKYTKVGFMGHKEPLHIFPTIASCSVSLHSGVGVHHSITCVGLSGRFGVFWMASVR